MHLGMAECRVPLLGHYDLDLVFRSSRVRSISHMLFELGIPNTNVLSSLTIFGVCLHLGIAECHVVNVFLVRTSFVITSQSPSS